MRTNSNLAKVATLVSDPSRAALLTVLLDGRFHAASELAQQACLKPPTASFHLAKMVDALVVTVEKQGRHRYYGIQDQEVAEILESLLSIAPPVKIKSLKQASEDQALRSARTCYDHLAGSLGVQVTDSLIRMGVLREENRQLTVTDQGEVFFADLQIDLKAVGQKRRSFSHTCLDWSERRHHLGGALGNALLERFLELAWVQRVPGSRAIRITPEGKKGLREVFLIGEKHQ